MKNINCVIRNFIILCSFLSILSCDESEIPLITNPQTEIQFKVEKINSQDDESFFVKSTEVTRGSYWYEKYFSLSENGFFIVKTLYFEHDNSSFSITIEGEEQNKTLLILETEGEFYKSQTKWNYIDSKIEMNNFWKNPKITFDIGHGIYMVPNYKILKIDRVLVDGVEKIYVEFSFSGTTKHYYPYYYNSYQDFNDETLIISEGIFKGVVE